ncbi:MAG: tetratricopeptide repeat protein, partial [Planctomycetota bacterium]
MTRILVSLLLFVGLGSVLGLGGLLFENSSRTALDFLTAAEDRLAAEQPDVAAAPRELAFGIQLAERDGDDRVLATLLETRGRMHRKHGAVDEAVADFERLLTLPHPDPSAAYLELAELAWMQDDIDQAIEIVDGVLAEHPERVGAHLLRARSTRTRADSLLEEARALARETLPAVDVPLADSLIDQIAHLPSDKPLRAAKLNEFNALFTGPFAEGRDKVRVPLDQAAAEVAATRSSVIEALKLEIDRDAAFLLLDILRRAGNENALVDLGGAFLTHPPIARDLRSMQLFSQALDSYGRPQAATAVIQSAIPEEGGPQIGREFLMEWGRILYELEDWVRLERVAKEMGARFSSGKQFANERDAAKFFKGVALINQPDRPDRPGQANSRAQAIAALSGYIAKLSYEPVPDALAVAWRYLADVEKLGDDVRTYEAALVQTVERSQDFSGETWLELADLRQEIGAPPIQILVPLTHAIRLLPGRRDELYERWVEEGNRTLDSSGRDLEQLRSDLARKGQWTSEENENPYEQFRLAEIWHENGRETGTISACHRILDSYPRFLPAVDLLAETYLELGREDLAIPMLLERQRNAPQDGWGYDRLRELEQAGSLTPADRFEL